MAVADKALQVDASGGTRRVPDAGIVEVGTGIVSSGVSSLSIAGSVNTEVVVNEAGVNLDFRVEGTLSTDLLFVDASADAIGLKVAAPQTTLDMAGGLTIRGGSSPGVSPAGQGRIYFDSVANKFLVSENAGTYGELITGSGTVGHVAYWNGASLLAGEGDFYWDAANNRLGIGTPTPATAIEVAAGEISTTFGSSGSPPYTFIGDTNSGMYAGGADDVRIVTGAVDRVLARSTGVTLQGPIEEITAGTGTTLLVRLNNGGAGVDAKRWAFAFDSAVNTNAFRLITENDALSSTTEILAASRVGDIGVGTTAPGAKLDVRGGAIFNEDAATVDFRVEGAAEENLLFIQGSTNRIGVATNAPASRVHLLEAAAAVDGTKGVRIANSTASVVMFEVGNAGDSYVGSTTADTFNIRSNNLRRITALATGAMVINEDNLDYDLRVEGVSDPNLLFVDADVNRIGIGLNNPAGKVEIRDDSTQVNLLLTKRSVGVGNNDLAEFRTDAFTSGERHLFKWTSNDGVLVIGRYGMEFDALANTVDFVWRDMFNIGATTVEVMRLKGNGNLGLGVTDAATQLDMDGAFNVRGSAAPAVSPAGQGRLYFDSTSNTWKISENGGAYQDLLAVGGVGGSGAANQISFWTGASTLAGDSDFIWNSTTNRLGIAVGASPNTAVDMLGALSVRAIAAPAIAPAGEVRIYFDSGTNKTRISENGNPYQDLLAAAAGLTGSGSVNQVTLWSGATVLTGDAQLYWDNGNNYLGVDEGTPSSTLDVGGSVAGAVVTVTVGTTALDDTHHTVLGDASGGVVNLTLPLASAADGRVYRVKKIDSSSNNVNVNRSGADTIDGQTSIALGSQYEALDFVSNGTNWFLF